MTIASVLSFIFQFFPKFYNDLVDAIKEFETARLKSQNANAVDESSATNDQRPVEELINPQQSGELSGRTDSEVVDSIPNF